jgi:NAD+ synthase (glutamine-hydrolysing)
MFSENSYRKIKFSLEEMNADAFSRELDPHPFVPSDRSNRDERCKEIFSIQTLGLVKRLRHTGSNKVIIGISGGLDSTLALLVAVKTFETIKLPLDNIIGVTMPGFGTSDGTRCNALDLMHLIGTSAKEIDIKDACLCHFKDIGQDETVHDITYENTQARERTQILMDIANKENALVIGTGDMSELALGWCTYNGDHMSMYSVNSGVPKTLVRYLVEWVKENLVDEKIKGTLEKIIATPISPELIPLDSNGEILQKTENILGPYELHDFFLYHIIRYGASPKKVVFLSNKAFEGIYDKVEIKSRLKEFYKRFFSQQFKRSCLPDGPKVGTISLSPRGDLRMPSDADVDLWLDELE